MTDDCIKPHEVAAALALPVDHPRRRHMETCLHCRALVNAYREFLDPGPDVPDLDITSADAELARRLDTILSGGHPARPAGTSSTRGFAGRRAWLAAAAVLALCAGIFLARDAVLLRDGRIPDGEGLRRGDPGDVLGAAWMLGPDGWLLSWVPPDAAERSVAVFYDAGMAETARDTLAAGAEVVMAASVPGNAVYLQILVVAAGDTVGRSAILTARPDGS